MDTPSTTSLTLLRTLCGLPATAGDEKQLADWVLNHVLTHRDSWVQKPEIFAGEGFQDAVVLVFGQPKVAVFAHLDGVGFCAAYGNKLVPIGKPKAETGAVLVGSDSQGDFEATLEIKEEKKDGKTITTFYYICERSIDRGTPLTYKPFWEETEQAVQCCYLDNRVGVWNALELCAKAENVALVFTTYEEHGGGAAQFIGRFLYKSFGTRQALISDVTLVSEGILQGSGVAISMRDRGIPRQSYVRKICRIADAHELQYQLEVEDAGGSDGNQLQASSYPWDWCFIGPPETGYHSPSESVFKTDLISMNRMYSTLIKAL